MLSRAAKDYSRVECHSTTKMSDLGISSKLLSEAHLLIWRIIVCLSNAMLLNFKQMEVYVYFSRDGIALYVLFLDVRFWPIVLKKSTLRGYPCIKR